MALFERMREMRHEQVAFCHEESCGLKAIIAIHDTILDRRVRCEVWGSSLRFSAVELCVAWRAGPTRMIRVK